MGRVNHYLLRHFSSLFASLFFTLFFITSIVFFIKIASITSVIKINFYELGLLYLYLLPSILTYTLPVTFFIALCISLFNLSKENETIVLFTLGYTPRKIAKLFVIVSFLLSLLLLINILILIPTAKQLNSNFLNYKKAEAKFNIKETELGQKFSDWLVFIDKSDKNNSYSGVVMYQEERDSSSEKIIIARSADINNHSGTLKLKLDDGKAFQLTKGKIEQVNFEKMYLSSQSKNNPSEIVDVISYWKFALTNKKRVRSLSFLILIALFPIATVLFAISIGIVTYRYKRGNIYIPIALVTVGYLAPGFILIQFIGIYAVLISLVFNISISYLYYRKKISLRY